MTQMFLPEQPIFVVPQVDSYQLPVQILPANYLQANFYCLANGQDVGSPILVPSNVCNDAEAFSNTSYFKSNCEVYNVGFGDSAKAGYTNGAQVYLSNQTMEQSPSSSYTQPFSNEHQTSKDAEVYTLVISDPSKVLANSSPESEVYNVPGQAVETSTAIEPFAPNQNSTGQYGMYGVANTCEALVSEQDPVSSTFVQPYTGNQSPIDPSAIPPAGVEMANSSEALTNGQHSNIYLQNQSSESADIAQSYTSDQNPGECNGTLYTVDPSNIPEGLTNGQVDSELYLATNQVSDTMGAPDYVQVLVGSGQNETVYDPSKTLDSGQESKGNCNYTVAEIMTVKSTKGRPVNCRFVCNVCQKVCWFERTLKLHYKTHEKGKLHTCEICQKSFKLEQNLRAHKKIHVTLEFYSCTLCQKAFSCNKYLKEHYKTVHSLESYACKVCLKSFTDGQDLKEHYKTMHPLDKSFACRKCTETFNNEQDLKAHRESQHVIKSYACTICQKSFTTNNYLKAHHIRHSMKKPFFCQICQKAFASEQDLDNHNRSHSTEPIPCKKCQGFH